MGLPSNASKDVEEAEQVQAEVDVDICHFENLEEGLRKEEEEALRKEQERIDKFGDVPIGPL